MIGSWSGPRPSDALSAAVFNGGNLVPVAGTPDDWTALADYVAAFSPNGKQVAVGDSTGAVVIWDLATRTRVGTPLTGHNGGVIGLAYSPDGKELVTASGDGKLRLWDLAQHKLIGEPLPGTTGGGSVEFLPDGKHVLGMSRPGSNSAGPQAPEDEEKETLAPDAKIDLAKERAETGIDDVFGALDADLVGLARHQSSPYRVALWPDIFPLVIEALCVFVDDDAEYDAVEPRDDATVEFGRSRINGHSVALGGITNLLDAAIDQHPQYGAAVVARPSNEKVTGRLTPVLFHPLEVCLETTCCRN